MQRIYEFPVRIWNALVAYQENVLRRQTEVDDNAIYGALEGPLQTTLMQHVRDLNGSK